jgi:hypothetical protein
MLSDHPPYRRQLPLLENFRRLRCTLAKRSDAGRSWREERLLPTACWAGWGVEIDEAVIAAHPEDPNAKLNMFSLGWEQQMCRCLRLVRVIRTLAYHLSL